METESKKKHGVRNSFFILFVVVCVAAAAYIFRGAAYNELNSLKLIPTPEKFTELYFTDSAAIPTSTTPGKPTIFAFTITNNEGVTTTYPYTSYFMDPTGQKLTLANGTVSLPNGASTIVNISYTFVTPNVTGEVIVALPSLDNQQIDFLLPYNNG